LRPPFPVVQDEEYPVDKNEPDPAAILQATSERSKRPAGKKQPFYRQAAKFSMYAPIFLGLVFMVVRVTLWSNQTHEAEREVGLTLSILYLSAVIAGVVLGVVGLVGAFRRRDAGTIVTAVIGLILNGAIVAGLPFAIHQARLAAQRGRAGWQAVEESQPKWRVEMPGQPKRQVIRNSVPDGEIIETIHASEDGLAAYTARCCQFPKSPIPVSGEDDFIKLADAGLDATITPGTSGKLIYRKTVSHASHTGREQRLEFNERRSGPAGGTVMVISASRAFSMGSTAYILTVVVEKGTYEANKKDLDARIQKFFRSLEFD
jgi:hypothetical protein